MIILIFRLEGKQELQEKTRKMMRRKGKRTARNMEQEEKVELDLCFLNEALKIGGNGDMKDV